ncbi:SPOR domain-containing protein [Vibrio sp. RC27]
MNTKFLLCASVFLTACSSGTYVTDVKTEGSIQDYNVATIEPVIAIEEAAVPSLQDAKNETKEKATNLFGTETTAEQSTATIVDIKPPTEKQMKAAARFGYSIQVVAVSNEMEATKFASQLPQQVEPIWQNYKQVNGTNWYTVLYGDYATKSDAKLAIKDMPKNIRDLKPFVKSIDEIKNSAYPMLKKLN